MTTHLLVLATHLLVLTTHLLVLTTHLLVLTTHLLVLTTHLLVLTTHLLVLALHDHLIIEPVEDSLEAERRSRMVKAIAKYIHDHRLPLEITETVIVKGSQCSPFRGDFFLFGEKNNTVIIILDDEEEGTCM